MSNLSLDTWRDIIGYHPWHFWQFESTNVPVMSSCNTLVYEKAWIGVDAAGRDDMRRALDSAESRLREALNFSVGRRWVEETIQFPRPSLQGHEYYAPVGGSGRWLNVRACEGHIRACGKETYTAIETAQSVTYSDEDGDGIDELFTLTVAGFDTTISLDQVEVHVPSAERYDGSSASDRWRIAPVSLRVSGTDLIIRGPAWIMARPILYQRATRTALDPDNPPGTTFLDAVDVYRHYTDPDGQTNSTAQATLIWETPPWPAFCDSGLTYDTNAADPAALAYALARVGIRDSRLGELALGEAVYDSDSAEWTAVRWDGCRQPDRVILRYEAGVPLDETNTTLRNCRAVGRWEEIVARLAAAELSRRICGCDDANRELYRWQFDLALTSGIDRYQIDRQDLANPLGTRAGQVYAWKAARNLLVTRAFLL